MRNQKILKNTLFLYVRQILIVCFNLYAIRVVLNTLGIEDYGIYTLVAGFVTLLAFLPGTMASATQRFFSYALGENDQEKLNKIFSANWVLYLAIATLIVLILETIGYWYLTQYIKIPTDRTSAALTLYHFTVASFALSVFSAPFMAVLIAHEDMHLYAIISIIESLLKLVAAIVLAHLPWDSLPLYGQLLLCVAVVNSVTLVLLCKKKYIECQFTKIYWDGSLVKEILSFTGWTMFGQITNALRNQAVTILLNQFFNPAIVASRAIAMTVASQSLIFAQNFNMSMYPSIIKTYANNQQNEMFSLVNNGSKLTFFLMWVFALPMLIEIQTILEVWLKNPPPSAVTFTRLAIIETLILSISLPITSAARAPGKMKLYELSLGTIQILIFFTSWIVLKLGHPAEAVFIVAIIANLLMFKIRLLLVKRLIKFPMTPYYKQVVAPTALVTVTTSIPVAILHAWLPSGLPYTFSLIFISILLTTIAMFYLGLDQEWRIKIISAVYKKIIKR